MLPRLLLTRWRRETMEFGQVEYIAVYGEAPEFRSNLPLLKSLLNIGIFENIKFNLALSVKSVLLMYTSCRRLHSVTYNSVHIYLFCQ